MNIYKWTSCLGVCALGLQLNAAPMGSAFSYQGRLNSSGGPALDGIYDFRFTLYDAEAAGSVVGSSYYVGNVPVTNGIFTAQLYFLTLPFTTGEARWLQLEVNTNGTVPLITLNPRQRLTPIPQAIYAGTAGIATTAAAVAASAVGTTGLANGAVNSAKIADESIDADDLNPSLLRGTFWNLTGNPGTSAGIHFLGTTDTQPLELRVNNLRALRLQPGFLGRHSIVGGANQADASLQGATVAGGYNSVIQRDAHYATIGGGNGNIIQPDARGATIAGGVSNWILTNAAYATIGGGRGNTIQTNVSYGTIGGGADNVLSTEILGEEFASTNAPNYSSVGGGEFNVIHRADWAALGGGRNNYISGDYGTIPGGWNNRVTGGYALAAGRRAQAIHSGAFVWADSTDADFASTAANQFRVRAAGGMEVAGGSDSATLHFSGSRVGGHFAPVGLAENHNAFGVSSPALRVINLGGNSVDGALSVSAHGIGSIAAFGNAANWVSRLSTDGTWTALGFEITSDRNAKENFEPVDSRAVLDQVVNLTMTRWNYKTASGVQHIGPMAQDFHAAFGVGSDDKHIATVDADGVALAAIQGLNQKVEEQSAENQRLKSELAEIKRVLGLLTRQSNGGVQ